MMRLLNNELRELALFSDASRTELALIATQITRLTVPAGKVLVREGGRGTEFMIVVEGEAAVTQSGIPIAMIGRGDLVGEMALLERQGSGRRNATVTAVTDMVIYVGSHAEFNHIIDIAPTVAEKVRQTAASRRLIAA
jgi:CRP/FNR family transcriptional regulator, cyclic AMP receptor protein